MHLGATDGFADITFTYTHVWFCSVLYKKDDFFFHFFFVLFFSFFPLIFLSFTHFYFHFCIFSSAHSLILRFGRTSRQGSVCPSSLMLLVNGILRTFQKCSVKGNQCSCKTVNRVQIKLSQSGYFLIHDLSQGWYKELKRRVPLVVE